MPRYRATIEYDGSFFSGWQIQRKDTSIQETFEHALFILFKEHITITGSGRTDAGVHATGQVAHFDLNEPTDTGHLAHALNGLLLPKKIAVLNVSRTHDSFHARFDARERLYRYQTTVQPRALDRHMRVPVKPEPDFMLMNSAASYLLGEQNFSAFCRTGSKTRNRICNVMYAQWTPEQREGDWSFIIKADRFLHGMVRAIVGTLLETGRGKRKPEDIIDVIQSQDRTAAGPAAPACGLILEKVNY